jgi:hypothetical protein
MHQDNRWSSACVPKSNTQSMDQNPLFRAACWWASRYFNSYIWHSFPGSGNFPRRRATLFKQILPLSLLSRGASAPLIFSDRLGNLYP